MKGTDIFNGTNGTLWLSTDDMEIPVGSFQTFTLHQNNEFEDVNEAEFLGKKKRLLGKKKFSPHCGYIATGGTKHKLFI